MPDAADPSGLPPATVVETHISTLFFVGERVYKLKKPIRLPFVDQSTRVAREQLCRREVELNRRLSPDVYLGVADVVGPDEDSCDHLVVMRRLPEDRRLSEMVRAGGAALPAALDDLAALLATFHANARRGPDVERAGARPAIANRWSDLFSEIRSFPGQPVDPEQLEAAERLVQAYLEGRGPLFSDRVARGSICDGHGDLQTDDVFCLDDGPRVLDCIEFDDELRHVDVADDVAFLVMDLERLGAPVLGERFLTSYERATRSELPHSLVAFYVAYRALVRCMVACTRAHQEVGEASETARGAARQLLELCVERLRTAQPMLVLVGGLPGTGKTTVATAITGDRAGQRLLRSDVVRKELAGMDPGVAAPSAFGTGLYDESMTGRVYRELADRAQQQLELGRNVVLDASFPNDWCRGLMRTVAGRSHSRLVELRCVLDREVADARIVRRAAEGGDASDATPEVAAAMAEQCEPWPEGIELPTAGSPSDVLARARRALADRVEE